MSVPVILFGTMSVPVILSPFPQRHPICHRDLAVKSIRGFLKPANASDILVVRIFAALEDSNCHFSKHRLISMCVRSQNRIQVEVEVEVTE